MKNESIVFTAPWQVEVQQLEFTGEDLQPNQLLVEKRYSLISNGTELACLSGNEHWFSMPKVPGYTAVSNVIKVGDQVTEFKAGDTVFHYGNHSRFEILSTDQLIVVVPDSVPLTTVPFVRLATIAMTAIRTSTIELGDYVAVTGLGLVGNMAAQLAQLQGAQVIGIDFLDQRISLAQQCGISRTLNGNEPTWLSKIKEITNQEGVGTLIEATGIPQSVEHYISSIAKGGELILLGSPRGEYNSNITNLLNYVHLSNNGLTFKGAHEWKYPLHPQANVKHSLTRNSHIALQLIAKRKLHITPLISHIVNPLTDAPAVYDGIRHKKNEYIGVLFEWTK